MTIYTTGTVSVTNGNAVVAGSGTAWALSLIAGGMFSSAGLSVPIASVESDTSLTLAYAWPGTTASSAVYAIGRENSDAASVVNLYATLSRVLVTLSLAGITPNASGSLTDRDALVLDVSKKGFLFLRAELGVAFAFYRWTGTAWDGPFPIAGDAGSSDVTGTSATSLAIATGSKTFTVVENKRGWSAGARVRASSRASGANFMEGVVTSYSVNTLIVAVDLIGGSGTLTDWNINLAGQQGAAGTGDVVGPASAVADRLARFNGTTGKLIKDGGLVVTADLTDANVTLAKIANIATARLLGRTTAGSGVTEELTAASAKAMLALGNVDNTSDATKNSSTATLTNKRITVRVGTVASSAAPAPDADSHDEFTVTALAVNATFAAPTGTPTDGQKLVIRIKDNATARTLAFNAIYRASSDLALPTTTILSKTLYLGFIYNSADSKWDLVALLNNF